MSTRMVESGGEALLALLQVNGCASKFKPDAIAVDTLETILTVACHTPSPWNLQTSQFIVARTEASRSLILRHCPDPGLAATAPALVVALGDPGAWKRAPERLGEMVRLGGLKKADEAVQLERIRRLWSSSGAARLLAVARTHAAVQQLCMAALTFDVGTCWVPEFDAAALGRALNIPENLLVAWGTWRSGPCCRGRRWRGWFSVRRTGCPGAARRRRRIPL
jgi:nitroreductase